MGPTEIHEGGVGAWGNFQCILCGNTLLWKLLKVSCFLILINSQILKTDKLLNFLI